MFPVSSEALNLLSKNYRQTAEITFCGLDNTFTLTESNIIAGGLTVDRYSVSSNRIELGSACAAELSLKLDNREGQFRDVKFEGAELFVRIGITKYDAGRWEQATTQYVPLGYFTVDEPARALQTIQISALDRMVLFDKTVDWSLFNFPITVEDILSQTCHICNVPLGTDISDRPNSDYVIQNAPTDETTYRQIIQWVAELTATCGFIDWEGKLRLSWYKPTTTRISPSERYSSDMLENDIVISGVEVVDEDSNVFLAGNDSYAFRVEGNSLIQHDYQQVCDAIYTEVGGFIYRPYECVVKPMPYLFPMDMVEYVDKDGNSHQTIVTNITFTLNGSTSVKGQGETETKSGYATANPMTKRESLIINSLKKNMNETLSNGVQSVLAFNELITNSLGVYSTMVTMPDGSKKYYMHDAPTIEESSTIYTQTAGGFAYTNDGWNGGDPVWQYGFAKDGNVIARMITADIITSGILRGSKGESYWNLDTGEFVIKNGKYTSVSNHIFESSNYDTTDCDRVRNIVFGEIEPTEEDMDKYDFFRKGKLTSMNALIINKMLLGLGDFHVMRRVTIDTSNGDIVKIDRASWHGERPSDLPWIPIFQAGAGGTNINEDLSINGESVSDYIVENGTSGEWTYRKWHSGISECWCETSQTVTTTSGWNTFGAEGDNIYFPSGLFIDSPVVNVNTDGYRYCHPTISAVNSTYVSIYYMTAIEVTVSPRVFIRAIGSWK